jgi:hypothetical protein
MQRAGAVAPGKGERAKRLHWMIYSMKTQTMDWVIDGDQWWKMPTLHRQVKQLKVRTIDD